MGWKAGGLEGQEGAPAATPSRGHVNPRRGAGSSRRGWPRLVMQVAHLSRLRASQECFVVDAGASRRRQLTGITIDVGKRDIVWRLE